MTALKNVSTINVYNSEKQPTTINLTTTADTLGFYVSGGANNWMNFVKYNDSDLTNPTIAITGNFEGKVNEMLDYYLLKAWSGYNDSKFNGSARLAGSADLAHSASIAANTQDKITAYYKEGNTNKTGTFNVSSLALSAGKGINFVSAANQLSISSEGTTYTTGQYINISNDNKISVTGTLINSAQSGQSAYNWITAQSATLSAGPGIKFTSAGQNTMGITITAGGVGGVITAIAGSALSAGTNYTQGRCIVISGNNNKINLADDISVDTITADRLTNDGDAEAYISINHDLEDFGELYPTKLVLWRKPEGTHASISSMYSNRNISSFSSDGGYNFNSINVSANYINLESQNNGVHFILNMNDHDVSYTYNASTTTADWDSILRNANSNWVSSSPDGITISSNSVVKLVFTPTLPPTLDDNTYYIV